MDGKAERSCAAGRVCHRRAPTVRSAAAQWLTAEMHRRRHRHGYTEGVRLGRSITKAISMSAHAVHAAVPLIDCCALSDCAPGSLRRVLPCHLVHAARTGCPCGASTHACSLVEAAASEARNLVQPPHVLAAESDRVQVQLVTQRLHQRLQRKQRRLPAQRGGVQVAWPACRKRAHNLAHTKLQQRPRSGTLHGGSRGGVRTFLAGRMICSTRRRVASECEQSGMRRMNLGLLVACRWV